MARSGSQRGLLGTAAVWAMLALVIAVGAGLALLRMNSTSSDPHVLKVQAQLGAEEDQLREEWQTRIDEARSQLLVLERENQRLRQQAGER